MRFHLSSKEDKNCFLLLGPFPQLLGREAHVDGLFWSRAYASGCDYQAWSASLPQNSGGSVAMTAMGTMDLGWA